MEWNGLTKSSFTHTHIYTFPETSSSNKKSHKHLGQIVHLHKALIIYGACFPELPAELGLGSTKTDRLIVQKAVTVYVYGIQTLHSRGGVFLALLRKHGA